MLRGALKRSVWLHVCFEGHVLGRMPERVFTCKMAAAGDERYVVYAAVGAGCVSVANFSSVFCTEWLFL
jgi:hypothetical protein